MPPASITAICDYVNNRTQKYDLGFEAKSALSFKAWNGAVLLTALFGVIFSVVLVHVLSQSHYVNHAALQSRISPGLPI